MKYRRLGRTGLQVSVIGMGTWQFGGEWGKEFEQSEVDAILSKAAEMGINLIDTAECYGDHLAEKLVGRAIKGRRKKWILATKFGHRFNGPFQRDDVYEPAQVQEQLEQSLKALQTDYVDLYQFHSGTDPMFDTPGLWDTLQGFVQAVPSGTWASRSAASGPALPGQSRVGGRRETIQVVYNRINRSAEQEIIPSCRRQDLGVLARVPLASGFLSGKYTKPPISQRRTSGPSGRAKKNGNSSLSRRSRSRKRRSLKAFRWLSGP